MSDPKTLIERLCLSLHGETPALVLEVLPVFVGVVCDKYGMSIDKFVEDLRASAHAQLGLTGALAPKGPPS